MVTEISLLTTRLNKPSVDELLELTEQNTDYLPQASALTEAIQPSHEEKRALLESTLRNPEFEDQIWSADAQSKVESIFANTPSLNIANSYAVECGGTLCKIDAMLSPEAGMLEQQQFEMNFFMKVGKQLPRSTMNTQTLADGTTYYQVYAARRGNRLPTESPAIPSESSDDST